jgi:hypothetical protein
MIYITKYISLVNLDVLFFNDIIYMLYNWYQADQIDNLEMCLISMNWKRGTNNLLKYFPQWMACCSYSLELGIY